MRFSTSKTRPLLTVQTIAGVALLALAVPYSGCFTARVWNPDTVLVASKIEGRTKFSGNLGERYENDAGDIAYSGKMDFVNDDGRTYSEQGWLMIPGAFAPEWRERISQFHVPPISHSGLTPPASDLVIAVNPKPSVGNFAWVTGTPPKFLAAEKFLFHTKDSGFEPEKFGFRRVSPSGWDKSETGGIVFRAGESRRFTLDYNPVQRTGGSDALNVGGKVLMTPVTVAGDVAVTGAVIAGGAVVLAGSLVYAPFYYIGKAVAKATKPDPEKADSTDGASKQDESGPECVPEK